MNSAFFDVCVVGLGHIGLPILVSLQEEPARVLGVDVSADKVQSIKEGKLDLGEPGVTPDVLRGLEVSQKLPESKVYYLCLNIIEVSGSYMLEDTVEVIRAIATLNPQAVVVIRSTIDLDAMARLRELKSEALCRRLSLLFCPEFLREGKALSDLRATREMFGVIFADGESGCLLTLLKTDKLYSAETLALLKISCNAWRATKVSFANLMMMICESNEIPPQEFYELFVQDELNTSKAYLRPGSPYGGFCLPKETRIMSRIEGPNSGLFSAVEDINRRVTEFWADKILSFEPACIYFETLSFKPGVPDVRSSALAAIRERLITLGAGGLLVDAIPRETLNGKLVFVTNDRSSDRLLPGETQVVLIEG